MIFNQTLQIVIWVIGFLIILSVIFSFIDSGDDATRESTCRSSIMLSENTKVETLLVDFSTPKICKPPSEIEVIDGEREEIKYQISELAAKCWWMWLEGEVSNIFDAKKNTEKCAICYYFTIEQKLDEGERTQKTFLDEPNINQRSEENITMAELYNYMMSTTYNRKLLYGGGTQNYIGDHYNFQGIRLNNPQEIRLSRDIEEIPLSHVQDFTGIIQEDTIDEITKLGVTLMDQDSLLFVIVADQLQRNDRKDARQLVEKLNMNSNKNLYDAALITLDVTRGTIRVHLGGELEEYINELEIKNILETNFDLINNEQDLNDALQNLAKTLNKIITEQTSSETSEKWRDDSFYSYLSNDGMEQVYISDIQTHKTYAIAYSSKSNIIGFFKAFISDTSHYSNKWVMWGNALTASFEGGSAKNSIIISNAQYMDEMCQITQ